MSKELNIANGVNIRDLGGYPTGDGATVKKHQLIRSGYLSDLTHHDQQYLYDYGVRTIIDLRTTAEARQYPDHLLPAMRLIRIPILQERMGDAVVRKQVFKGPVNNAQAGFQHMLRLYLRLVASPEAQQSYHRFLTALTAALPNGGVLFHCSTGKDRTGIATMIVLHLLGVAPQVIRQDYLLTNKLSAMRVNQRMSEARQVSVAPEYLKAVFDISTVRPLYYDFAETAIKYLYGDFDSYAAKQLGVSNELVETLKRSCLSY
ncbi:tyrosine-protein phosphatase [Limosilactobacillus avium]|uniref:tyrosine-protein phosphatase n=1 Tax=Limosilactobacillus avium TaxID=2991831 RepID=UPI0024BA7736|nr:tyrosine-protein phosphatase [Limosilactobacillus avium]